MDESIDTTFRFTFIEKLVWCSSSALALYDWALTFFDEIELILSGRLTSVALCLFNRVALLGWTMALILWMQPIWHSNKSCKIEMTLSVASMIMLYTAWAALSALRVYALSNRNLFIVCLTFFLGIMPALLYIVFQNIKIHDALIPLVNACGQVNLLNKAAVVGQILATRICAMLSDTMVLLVTWYYLYPPTTGSSRWHGLVRMYSVGFTMLRDGTVYFIVMLVINLTTTIVSWYVAGNDDSPSNNEVMILISNYMNTIMGVMISRFMLNLRKALKTHLHDLSSEASSSFWSQDKGFNDRTHRLSANAIATSSSSQSAQSDTLQVSNDDALDVELVTITRSQDTAMNIKEEYNV